MAAPGILLVGDSETRPRFLAERLTGWGGKCQFASCRADVAVLLKDHAMELVLSRMRLADGSAFELIPLVEGQAISLFSYLPAKDGFWWLPLVQSGEACAGSPARPEPEFMQMLEELVRKRAAALGSEGSG